MNFPEPNTPQPRWRTLLTHDEPTAPADDAKQEKQERVAKLGVSLGANLIDEPGTMTLHPAHWIDRFLV